MLSQNLKKLYSGGTQDLAKNLKYDSICNAISFFFEIFMTSRTRPKSGVPEVPGSKPSGAMGMGQQATLQNKAKIIEYISKSIEFRKKIRKSNHRPEI